MQFLYWGVHSLLCRRWEGGARERGMLGEREGAGHRPGKGGGSRCFRMVLSPVEVVTFVCVVAGVRGRHGDDQEAPGAHV